jgi:hypothetical protein
LTITEDTDDDDDDDKTAENQAYITHTVRVQSRQKSRGIKMRKKNLMQQK